MPTRRGLSLVELLVALAILALVVGLILAAVQKARHRAALTQNENAVRQIVLAGHGYDAAHGRLPGTGPALDASGEPVFFYDILPYIEEGAVSDEFARGPNGAIVAPAAPGTGPGRVIRLYVSSTDVSNPQHTFDGLGCASFTPNRGVLSTGSGLARSFPDGTSNTILIAERLMLCGDTPNPWFRMAPKYLVFAAAPPPGNFGPPAAGCNPERVSSTSPVGIVVGLADGSARLVTPTVAISNWVPACDPEDGERLDW